MLTRKIGKLVRGKATPFQIMSACVLGSMIAFVPGFMQGPGLTVALLLVLLVLNANLGLAALVGIVAKLASLALMPLSFEVGRVLLDGPTQGLFKAMINAPVLALFGFEHYATTGGMVLGLAFGVTCGVLVTALIRRFRLRMEKLEEGSERYQKYASKKWVRFAGWVLFGKGHGKASYAELASRRVGNPVRVVGVVAVALFAAFLLVARLFLAEPLVTAALQHGLERANGATVDVGTADLDLSKGRLVVTGLAMADPNALETDVFRAAQLEANISGADLLRKRIVLDRVAARDAASGAKRAVPGHRVGARAKLPDDAPAPREGEKTLEDYVKQAQQWRERLAQVREWLDRVGERGAEGEGAPKKETLEERLRRQVREMGYARVTASHLIDETPTVLVRELAVDGLKVEGLEGETLGVRGENLSTQPWLVTEKPRVEVTSESGKLGADVVLAGGGAMKAHVNGLDADRIGSALSVNGTAPISGGTVDVSLDGAWGSEGVGYVDLPLEVVVHDSTVTLGGVGSAEVSRFALPVGVRGPMDDPRISIDPDVLAKALADAGASALADRVRGEAEKALEEATGEVKKKVGDEVGKKVKDLLGGG